MTQMRGMRPGKRPKNRRLLIKQSIVLAAAITVVAQAADAQRTSVVERSFQAVIVAADPARHTIRVRHKPTGYEADVVWNEKSNIQVNIPYDIDEIPEGWVECYLRKVDLNKKTISQIDSIRAYPSAKTPPAQADAINLNP